MVRTREVGVIGLGKMGSDIARVLHNNGGYPLVLYNRSEERYAPFRSVEGIQLSTDIQDFAKKLRYSSSDPAIVWTMLPGGEVTNQIMHRLAVLLRRNDIVIDGSNAAYQNSVSNYNTLSASGVFYLDVGCAGGPEDVLKGITLFIGGDKVAFEEAENVFNVVAGENTYGYVGESGAGQMAKLFHNLVFYVDLAVRAEMVAALERMAASEYGMHFDIRKALELYSMAPPITTDIMRAISETYARGAPSGDGPQIPLSQMLKDGLEQIEKLGVPLTAIRSVLELYPSMPKRPKEILAAAKTEITGH